MESSAPRPAKQHENPLSSSSRPQPDRRLWHDPLVLIAFLTFGLMAGFQLAIHLLHPPWISLVNNWLLFVLAWPELLVLALLSWWFSHAHRPGAGTWWLLSAAQLCYALRRTLLLAGDPALAPHLFFSLRWSDLFFLLQVPCLFLAFLLLPTTPTEGLRRLARLRMFLDCLLLMGAATLLSWYFLVAPLYMQDGQLFTSRVRNLPYVIVGLGLLFILIIMLTRVKRPQADRISLGLLILAVILALIGDFWFVALNLPTRHATEDPPDAFWILAYLLLPLAGLLQFRLGQWTPQPAMEKPRAGGVPWQDLLDCLRFLLPFVLPLLASLMLIIWAIVAPPLAGSPLLPFVLGAALLALVLVRQGVIFLEILRLRREREAAHANELALREATVQMDTFVGIASHELKTPLTVMTLHQQRAQRRLRRLSPQENRWPPEAAQAAYLVEQDLLGTEVQLKRQGRLIRELLEVSRIQAGYLELHLEPADLSAIVRAEVEEQREAWSERTIQLSLSAEPMSVHADPDRIGQVVTNYLTNALKYSPADRPVVVGVQRAHQQGYVWVRDQGPGLPPAAHERVWERFYRVPGIEIQDGSGIGLGIGLYICKTIVEGHHGQLGVESIPGQGATFWFTVPLAASESGEGAEAEQ